jgi:hypothetical protein
MKEDKERLKDERAKAKESHKFLTENIEKILFRE